MGILDTVAIVIIVVAGIVFTIAGWNATDCGGESLRGCPKGYAMFFFGIALLAFFICQVWINL